MKTKEEILNWLALAFIMLIIIASIQITVVYIDLLRKSLGL